MADSLSIMLGLSNSCVSSQEPITITATITDTSSTPRTWTLDDNALWAYPGDTALPGSFLPGDPLPKLIVPAGGSLVLNALMVFKAAPAGASADFNEGIEYTVGASFTSGNYVATVRAVDRPAVWVVPSAPDPINVPGAGQLDFRSNLESGLFAAVL